MDLNNRKITNHPPTPHKYKYEIIISNFSFNSVTYEDFIIRTSLLMKTSSRGLHYS